MFDLVLIKTHRENVNSYDLLKNHMNTLYIYDISKKNTRKK